MSVVGPPDFEPYMVRMVDLLDQVSRCIGYCLSRYGKRVFIVLPLLAVCDCGWLACIFPILTVLAACTCTCFSYGMLDVCCKFSLCTFKGEVHDFYKTSWFIEFEALSRMVKVRGTCDKPFKRYSRLKKLTFERLQGTDSWRN